MPVYEYRCKKGHTYEKSEGFDAPARQRCPTCRSDAQRLISMPAVIFKGSGFYSTDNRRGTSLDGGNGAGPSAADGAPDGALAGAGDGHSHGDGHGHSHGPGGHTH